jgi:hypothetical protein
MLAAVLSTVARAEIYEWSDETGTNHFTTSADRIPAEHRSSARVMVKDKPASPQAERGEPGAAPQSAPSRMTRGVGPRARRHFGSGE